MKGFFNWLREYRFYKAQKKAELAWRKLGVMADKLGQVSEKGRREIFKRLLRAAGYAGIRLRRKRA